MPVSVSPVLGEIATAAGEVCGGGGFGRPTSLIIMWQSKVPLPKASLGRSTWERILVTTGAYQEGITLAPIGQMMMERQCSRQRSYWGRNAGGLNQSRFSEWYSVVAYTVHDVDMKPIGIVLHDGRRALLAQTAKVGAQDGRRNDRRRRHDDLQRKATWRYRWDRRFGGGCGGVEGEMSVVWTGWKRDVFPRGLKRYSIWTRSLGKATEEIEDANSCLVRGG